LCVRNVVQRDADDLAAVRDGRLEVCARLGQRRCAGVFLLLPERLRADAELGGAIGIEQCERVVRRARRERVEADEGVGCDAGSDYRAAVGPNAGEKHVSLLEGWDVG